MRGRLWVGRAFFLLVALFLLGPILVLAGVSVNEQKSLHFPPQGFSTSWYADIVRDEGWR